MSYLIYCIFETAGEPEIPAGVEGQPVTLVEGGGLSAAVSQAPADVRCPDIPRVLAYEKVVESLHRGRAVLPVRYGCLLEDESRVIELLRQHGPAYRSALQGLEGCVELGIRILPEDAERGTRPCRLDGPSASPGKAYLAVRRAHYDTLDGPSGGQAEAAERCRAALAGLFVTCKTEYPSDSNPVFSIPLLSLYFLVRRECLEAFHQAFQALSRRESTRLLLSGPWPPYNFVPSGLPGHTGDRA